MWLAVVMFCTTPNVTTCQVLANTANFYYSEEACMKDATDVANAIILQRSYAKAGCFKLDESV